MGRKFYDEDWELESITNVGGNPYEFVIKYKLTQKAIDEGKAGEVDPKVDISVTKSWTGDGIDLNNLPDVYFQLMDGNKKVEEPKQLAKNEKTVIWKDMPAEKNGRTIYYTVEEVNADGSPWAYPNFERGKVKNIGGNLTDKDYKFNFAVTNSYIKSLNLKVYIDEKIKNGKLSVLPSTATTSINSGEEVRLVADPDKGYVFDSFIVKGADGYDVKIFGDKFIMPRVNVTVGAKFRELSKDNSIFQILVKGIPAARNKFDNSLFKVKLKAGEKLEDLRLEDIKVIASDSRASVDISRDAHKKDAFIITVTSENKDVKAYTLVIEEETLFEANANYNNLGDLGGIVWAGADNNLNPTKVSEDNREDKFVITTSNFIDINEHWAKEAIEFCAGKGYFKGISSVEFGPEMPIRRADFITVLGRIQNINVEKYKLSRFSDLEEGAYYTAYVNWAVENKIVSGFENGKFEPNSYITREQMALIISNYLKFTNKPLDKNSTIDFADESQISDWAKEAIKEMTQAGILKGMSEEEFFPKTSFTRAQVAQVLYNIYK